MSIPAIKTPQELLTALMADGTVETAVIVHKEAGSYANRYKEVQEAALACAQADLEANGETSRKTTFGSVGWTNPKATELDTEAWQTAVAANPALAALEEKLALAQKALQEAQKPFTRPRKPTFYCR
jgi:hypothetical protein